MRLWLVPVLVSLLLASTASAARFGGPSTVDNDDSCDISLLPAATLLLPYFEVDLTDPLGETTLFTVANVSDVEQVAHVTLWTDHGHPVLDFNIFLTGYDMQGVNLYDVLVRGELAAPAGTGFGGPGSPEGPFSSDHLNPLVAERTCSDIPRRVSPEVLQRVQRAFTRGESGQCLVGGTHANAVGYATIDVTRACANVLATDPGYYASLLLFDNVLIGDYQQVRASRRSAHGSPLVHIRSVPEGGAGVTELPRTFYSGFQNERRRSRDARQPLPSSFAAPWIGGADAALETKLKIWREPLAGGICTSTLDAPAVTEVVRFDEDENFTIDASGDALRLPSTSLLDVSGRSGASGLPASGNASGGWLYLNLDQRAGDDVSTQAWVVASMSAAGEFSVDLDVSALGNGCSPAAPVSSASGFGRPPIQPAPNASSGAETTLPTSTNNDDSCDISLLPAATLLLPYFEVDSSRSTSHVTTLLSITNTSPAEQIAQVTLWTHYGVPMLTFSVYLTGYDRQSIDLFDVLGRGTLPGGASGRPQGELSQRNRALDLSACGTLPRQLTVEQLRRLRGAFYNGTLPLSGDPACRTVSVRPTTTAVGYATIDVVRSCTTLDPSMPAYYTEAIAFDNVLTGDYQQWNAHDRQQGRAQGGPLVHIRAIPEGADAATRAASAEYRVNLPHTFYGAYQPRSFNRFDARQPLPSTFAARYADTDVSGEAHLKIWMQPEPPSCRTLLVNQFLQVAEVTTLDSDENATSFPPEGAPCICPSPPGPSFSATGRYSLRDKDHFPQRDYVNGEGGWIYLNLNPRPASGATRQAWVISSTTESVPLDRMTYVLAGVDVEATALGNGCTPAIGASEIEEWGSTVVIGPAPNTRPQ